MHSPPRILIVGRRNSGKSSLGALVAEHDPAWKSVATSDVTIALFAPLLGLSAKEVRSRKDSLRPRLIALSDPLVTLDAGIFVRTALAQGNVINGIRHPAEFEAVRGWFDLTVFISRPGNEIRENDNYNIPADMTATCDVHILNVGYDLSVLRQAAQAILSLTQN